MQITKNALETNPGPSAWFTGTVFVDTVMVGCMVSSSLATTVRSLRNTVRR